MIHRALLLIPLIAAPAQASVLQRLALQSTSATTLHSNCAGWVEVHERGQEVVLSVGDADQPMALAAPRYARAIVRVRAGAALSVRAVGPGTAEATVQFHCDGPSAGVPAQRATWLDQAQRAAVNLENTAGGDGPSAAELEALIARASSPVDRAFAVHLLANAAIRREAYAAASVAYRRSIEAWRDVDDAARTGIATLGLALAWRMRAQFDVVPKLADRAAALLPTTDAYYQARADEERCLAWHSLHQLQRARDCYTAVATRHHELGELDAELNSRYNQAFALRDLGDVAAAHALLDEAEQRATEPSVQPKTRGQLALLHGILARQSGEIGSALSALDRAAYWFSQAPELGNHWRANALVRIAEMYGQLGMNELAYRQLQQALSLYRASESPARIAGTLMKLAVIDRAQYESARAAQWFAAAGTLYRQLKLPLELAEAELGRLENSPPADAATARDLLKNPPAELNALAAPEAPRYAVLRARWMMLAGQDQAAQALLGTLIESAMTPTQRLAAQAMSGELMARSNPAGAQRALQAAMDTAHQETLAQGGALGYLLARQTRLLRDAWIDIALDHDTPPDAWWAAMLATRATQALQRMPVAELGAKAWQPAFGNSIASEMRGQVAGPVDHRLLQRLVARAGMPHARAASIDLAAVQRALPADTWLLVLMAGTPHSAGLWISADQAVVRKLADAQALHAATQALSTALGGRNQSIRNIDDAATTLSAALFAQAPTAAAPKRLWVVADELLMGAPLALLRWPGHKLPLIDTTAASWISAVSTQPPAAGAPAVSTLVADFSDSPGAENADLPPLWTAAREPDAVAKALAPWPIARRQGRAFSVDVLREALADPTALVHIASHGRTRTTRLGYSGLWLPSTTARGEPQFISWLDLVDQPLHARLVVLNVCELGASAADVREANVSFASAISVLGVTEVVAAHWAVSDTAGAHWVPVFYRRLRDDPADSAMALRQAQLALKQSRAFRHPYIWASLGHFRQLVVPISPAQ